ncbi:phosphomannomutase [Rheinheimera sediminis]|uniref:phosphomannomutase n=1 Tax=Rheinheimera sp. YQF-1 TaxID=2499626 RepID=UPI000FDCD8D9|nr:phosphomannomutase [Rheinheimera sp. YQF-1]RVT46851.1 phosphomannomutase [Rheinheimera sp. YQF-1]
MLNTMDVIANSGIAFGTSGARGLVTQFTTDVCAAFTHAFVAQMRPAFHFDTVAIGIDNRPSSLHMAQACAVAAQQAGLTAIFYGVLPTPALAFVAMQQAIPAIMVTGSHIPFDRNGLKFYRPDGEISKQDEFAIIHSETEFEAITALQTLQINTSGAAAYIERYLQVFPANLLQGKRIGIYQHSSAGRDLYNQLFSALGAEVITLERTDHFVPIDTEAVSEEDRAKARLWAAEHKLDAIFSTDGDGDRPLLADEAGNWLRGDLLCLLAARYLAVEALAVPVSCNTAIEKTGSFSTVLRTRIGSPYVIAAFNDLAADYKTYAGFEANGGFLLGSSVQIGAAELAALPTRDAVLPALAALALAGQGSVSALLASLPARYTASDRITNFATEASKAILAQAAAAPELFLQQLGFVDSSISEVNQTDGLRLTLANQDIIHLRPSGNAPELRCYAESCSEQAAQELVRQTLQGVRP